MCKNKKREYVVKLAKQTELSLSKSKMFWSTLKAGQHSGKPMSPVSTEEFLEHFRSLLTCDLPDASEELDTD